MNNVEVADKMVEALTMFQKEYKSKPFVMISHSDCDWYIKGLTRLRMMERHIMNLTSKGYDEPVATEQNV